MGRACAALRAGRDTAAAPRTGATAPCGPPAGISSEGAGPQAVRCGRGAPVRSGGPVGSGACRQTRCRIRAAEGIIASTAKNVVNGTLLILNDQPIPRDSLQRLSFRVIGVGFQCFFGNRFGAAAIALLQRHVSGTDQLFRLSSQDSHHLSQHARPGRWQHQPMIGFGMFDQSRQEGEIGMIRLQRSLGLDLN